MARGIRSKRWFEKPPVDYQVQWGHPYAKALKACWLMNERSGLTLFNGATKTSVGTMPASGITWGVDRKGSTLKCDGTNVNVSLGQPSELEPTTPFTATAWASRTVAFVGNEAIFCSRTMNDGTLGYMLAGRVTSNTVRFWVQQGASLLFAESDVALPLNTLTYIVGVWDGATVILYINGQRQATTASQSAITYSGSVNAQLGQYSVFERWQGDINDVRLYHRVLRPAEIQGQYANPYAIFTAPAPRIRYFFIPTSAVAPLTTTRLTLSQDSKLTLQRDAKLRLVSVD